MRHFSKWALAINVVLALCFHSYAVWYIFELHGQAWAIAGLLLPGVSELALCFSSVYEHDMIFNRYTIPFFSYLLLAFAVRFVLEEIGRASCRERV